MAKKRRAFTGKGGNFRQPTPAAAKAFLAKLAKAGITTYNHLVVGAAGIKDEVVAKQVRIRFREAGLIIEHYEKMVARYNDRLVTYKANLAGWKDCKKRGVKPEDCGVTMDMIKRPAKPNPNIKATDPRRAGNFKPMTVAQARNYAYRFFRQIRPETKKFLPNASGLFPAMKLKAELGARGSIKNFVPRVHEALEVLGMEVFTNVAQKARKAALEDAQNLMEKVKRRLEKNKEKMTAAEALSVKKIEAAKARVQKEKDKIEAQKTRLEAFMKSAAGKAVAARRRLRRNPGKSLRRKSARKARKSMRRAR